MQVGIKAGLLVLYTRLLVSLFPRLFFVLVFLPIGCSLLISLLHSRITRLELLCVCTSKEVAAVEISVGIVFHLNLNLN